MKLLWTSTFQCQSCNKSYKLNFFTKSDRTELSDHEKRERLEWKKYEHFRDYHTDCFLCGRNIKPGEINDAIWDGVMWKEICLEYALKNSN